MRRRAKFAADPHLDAQQRLATLTTLQLVGTGELLDHLRDAVREQNIAKAEAVRTTFMTRADKSHFEMQFGALFSDVVDTDARTREIELRQTMGVAALAEAFISEFEQGKPNPVARITAARAAGAAGIISEHAA